MTALKAGGLDARNIGSTISLRDEAARGKFYGTVQEIWKSDSGRVEVTLTGGRKVPLQFDDVVDITLPPAAHFQHQAVELMDSTLGEIEDLTQTVVSHLKTKVASVVNVVKPAARPIVASPAVLALKIKEGAL